MKKIKIFGNLTDVFKTNEYVFKEEINTVSELKEKLVIKFPELATSKFLIVVNNEYINDNKIIESDAEIALLPPYSGG